MATPYNRGVNSKGRNTRGGRIYGQQERKTHKGQSNSQPHEQTQGGHGTRDKTGVWSTRRGDSRRQQNVKVTASSQKKTPSYSLLAKVDAIKKSSLQYLEGAIDSDGSDVEDDEDIDKEKEKDLLEKTLRKYYLSLASNTPEQESNKLNKAPEFLSGSFLATSSTCLICLSSIRRTHAIWSCDECFCIFHMQCIHQWVVDGVKRQTLLSPQLFPNQEQMWSCPKCRGEYTRSKCPQKYHCFCGKMEDPPVDPWLLPHSCGEMCEKPLKPPCGHHCVALCHPGPCPPCPKTISVKCHCGRSTPTMRRCGSKGWSCGRNCRKALNCGQHICEEKCHDGPCPDCCYTLKQACQCGKSVQERPCTNLDWKCEQVCNKILSCGHHHCEIVCHSGECGTCPRSGERKCPCGKTSHVLPCTQEISTCGDTCGKTLSCKIHYCMRRCHYGNCGQCMEQVTRTCRCGTKSKALSCGSEYLCDVKCSNMKQCGRHQCKRKCCDGNCPPCELPCGKGLQCGRHKCSAPCHIGLCYPCVLMTTLSCNCGKTKIQIPCVQKRRTHPPTCHELCSIPPTCHHSERINHLCHSRACPPCEQVCDKQHTCGHCCPSLCHSEPKHRPKEDAPMNPTLPWSQMKTILQAFSEEVIITPCSPCVVPVPKSCQGEHKVLHFPCVQLKEYICELICGRRLACGNHVCENGCHKVINSPTRDEAGENCASCDLQCQRPRPSGCTHICHLPCHPEECPKCEVYLRFRCHCSTMPLFIKCHEWTSADANQKLVLQACNNQCTKILSCGHRCSYNCHAGECLPIDQCTRRLTLRCSCKRIKKDVKCNEKEEKKPHCDEECERVKVLKREEEERHKAEQIAEEERKKKEEHEALMRQIHGRPRRKRKQKEREIEIEEVNSGFIMKYRKHILIGGLSILVLVTAMIYYLVFLV